MDLLSLTIASALEQLQAGKFSPIDLAAACLQAIERLNPQINAFISIATAPPPANPSGPLAGIPLAIKDLIETCAFPTTAGTTFFQEYHPEQDAAVVEKLTAAGATLLGKTNTHEIALGVTGVNPHYGAVHNPWDLTRISGGSSSGSAAAVASGMCLAALGTDTGGSIRIPASLCGVVGLKPTFGRISLRGIFPLSWNLDHAGPLTKTVRDAALLLQVLAGYDELDPASVNHPVADYLSGLEGGVRGWRVGVLTGAYAWEADPEVLEAIRAAAEVFSGLGAQVEPVELDWLRAAAQANSLMTQADGAAYHRQRLAENPTGFGADVRQRLETGAAFTLSEYILARRTQTETRRRLEIFFEQFDLLILPSTPITAPKIEGNDALEQARRLTRFTAPFNLTGLPALSLPAGLSSAGLPFGVQLVSEAWSEAKLLQAGQAYETATNWQGPRPPVA
jgi:aspartyl-tRNA(Asn)/glutamyl-tRNA(Gln) amidotransferase subunit A